MAVESGTEADFVADIEGVEGTDDAERCGVEGLELEPRLCVEDA